VGGGGGERFAAHLRWLPSRPCPDGSAKHRDLQQPRGRRGYDDRIRKGLPIRPEAVSESQSASSLRAASGPAVAVTVTLAHLVGYIVALTVVIGYVVALAVVIKYAVIFAVAYDVALALALAYLIACCRIVIMAIPVGDGLGPGRGAAS
jgi:hypothetical protein